MGGFFLLGLYIVQGAESEKSERVVYVTKHLLDADVAKYNCAMLVIYSRGRGARNA